MYINPQIFNALAALPSLVTTWGFIGGFVMAFCLLNLIRSGGTSR
jgi:hypothetical protein